MRSKINLVILAFFIFSACKQQESKAQENNPRDEFGLSSDFLLFYDKFHSDSLFQLDHIIFPLEGSKYNEDNLAEKIIWTAENWILHKSFDDLGGTFTRSYTEFGGIISEKITDDRNISTMERRFSKMQGEWYLIYYDPIHLASSR